MVEEIALLFLPVYKIDAKQGSCSNLQVDSKMSDEIAASRRGNFIAHLAW
jgi:hypothetical protein